MALSAVGVRFIRVVLFLNNRLQVNEVLVYSCFLQVGSFYRAQVPLCTSVMRLRAGYRWNLLLQIVADSSEVF